MLTVFFVFIFYLQFQVRLQEPANHQLVQPREMMWITVPYNTVRLPTVFGVPSERNRASATCVVQLEEETVGQPYCNCTDTGQVMSKHLPTSAPPSETER